ncbi:DNA polymerase-4 [Herbihabitans rhizosphaerae]|uniref:DNA polymerase-4 n=1 Tax=Herbihabitans rhizosphaerae TaxID=1872711 RepID=A0A4Q7KJZ7_9PSEU|nr:DNA polymerase IV [Herbihabitans rhizosphaerae]RZS36526.1 DNA polymerase-4 [Herbihabitans rhizosphaerae]
MADTQPWVLHVDLDQFIVAVEVLRKPELKGRPVIVGGRGDPTERAVVASASYEAREFGVDSGMPLRVAAKRCPDAVLLPSDPTAYDEASEHVMATLREVRQPDGRLVVVEVMGWDEAFVGVTTEDPEAFATVIQDAVLEATELWCTVGIGDNKLRAKLATGFGKPRGRFRLTAANWYEVMGDRPTDALWGIGRKTARKLAELGYTTVRDLAAADADVLAGRLGPTMGPWYRHVGNGYGSKEVVGTPYVPRSRSRETTFQENLTDPARIREEVAVLAGRITEDVRTEGRPAARIAVKVRFAPFFTHTRSMTLPEPTSDGAAIERAALTVLDLFDDDRPVRLLGVRCVF